MSRHPSGHQFAVEELWATRFSKLIRSASRELGSDAAHKVIAEVVQQHGIKLAHSQPTARFTEARIVLIFATVGTCIGFFAAYLLRS